MKTAQQTFTELCNKFETQPPASLYFFCGEEQYYIEKLVSILQHKIVDQSTFDFNYDHFYADEVEGMNIINAASAFPMMADKRFVLVESVQKLSPSGKKQLEKYIESPVESTCLVLTAGKIDLRKKLYSSLKKKSVFFESKLLYNNQAADWVDQYFRKKKIDISREGASFLVDQIGVNLWNLHNECEKIITAFWNKNRLERSDIAEIVGFSRDCTIWEYTDFIGEKKNPDAQNILEQLIDNGLSPVYIIISLYQRIALLLKILVYKRDGKSDHQIAGILKFSPYFAKRYFKQSGNYTIAQLKKAVGLALKADIYLKTGVMEPKLILTGLTYEIISTNSGSKNTSIFI